VTAPVVDVDVSGLRCEVAGRTVLQLPRLQLRAGERVALIGPNGAGKSTLLRCLGALARPAAGQVQVLGADVPDLRGRALRAWRCDVAQVMQSLHLVGRLTVLDNVLIGSLGRRSGWRHSLRTWLRWPAPADVQAAQAALATVGLQTLALERTDRLSGGERQKAAIARLLMQRPRLVLADEPTAALDPAAAEAVCRLLGSTALQAGGARPATLITVVHNPALLPLLAERVLALRHGQLAFDLPLAQVTPALLAQLYSGDEGAGDPPKSSSLAGAPGPSVLPGDVPRPLPGLPRACTS
jgi:phosphonate transport system ATP-binding protein